MRKYKLTDETKFFGGCKVYRIQALKDFSDVKKGDLGGWVAGYHNLSHEGLCWVYDDAVVFENASVSDNAVVKDGAIVRKHATISRNAQVCDSAWVGDYVTITDTVRVFGEATISDDFYICDNIKIGGNADIYIPYISSEISGDDTFLSTMDYFSKCL